LSEKQRIFSYYLAMQLRTTGFSPRSSAPVCFLAAGICLAFLVPAADAQDLPQPNWDRTEALQTVAAADHDLVLTEWLLQIDRGETAQVLASIKLAHLKASQGINHHASQNTNLNTGPAFEAQLFELALTLAEAPLDAAVDDLLLWLAAYSSQVLVPHEERADYGVALYPVAAAALGASAERQRRWGHSVSMALLDSGALLWAQPQAQLWAQPQAQPKVQPQALLWVQRFLASGSNEQQGMTQSLNAARMEAIQPLAVVLQEQLARHPQLAAPAGAVASVLADTQLFLTAYEHSRGADSAALLREANWQLDAADRSDLLAGILALPTHDKAALGISMLAPALHSNPALSANLLDLLDDPQLGAAAALALAGHPDQRVQDQLQHLLQSGGLKARRAALALDQAIDPETTGDPQ